jgi:hypothetical protein
MTSAAGLPDLPLHPPKPIPERILSFGPAGTSKTTGWLDIAKWTARTRAPGRFFVLDTDFSVERMMPSYPEVEAIVDLSTGYDWTDYMAFQKRVLQNAGENDWVVIDFISGAWKTVQEEFVKQIHHDDMSDYFLKVRKQMSEKDNLWTEVNLDWSIINPMYFKWVNPLLFKGRWNIYATAQADQLSSDKKPTEAPPVRSLLLPFGVKPKGQKDLTYQFHTILLAGRDPRSRAFTFTTVKDRQRTEVSGQVVNSFTLDYLKAIAGWELT